MWWMCNQSGKKGSGKGHIDCSTKRHGHSGAPGAVNSVDVTVGGFPRSSLLKMSPPAGLRRRGQDPERLRLVSWGNLPDEWGGELRSVVRVAAQVPRQEYHHLCRRDSLDPGSVRKCCRMRFTCDSHAMKYDGWRSRWGDHADHGILQRPSLKRVTMMVKARAHWGLVSTHPW